NPAGEIMWSLDGPRRPDDVGDGADDEQQAAAAAEEAGLQAPTELEMFRIMYDANAMCDNNYVEFTRECDEQQRLMSRLLEQEPPKTVKKRGLNASVDEVMKMLEKAAA
ncbi:hypothetical protein Tco_0778521, partial [Tanacetum coccineum]